jgi:hypothetical protein
MLNPGFKLSGLNNMNAERLVQFLQLVSEREQQTGIQQRLTELHSALSNLQNSPQQPNFQSDVAARLTALSTNLQEFDSLLTPAQAALLTEIGGIQFFSPALADDIAAQMGKNSITPNVVFNFVSKLMGRRDAYLKSIGEAINGLSALGVKPETLAPGEAEIGFLIPRSLFDNRFDELIVQLRAINRIIRIFGEATVGRAEVAHVKQISSTDPAFFLAIDPPTIAQIGNAITWALNTLKRILEIKNIHHQAKQLNLPTEVTAPLEAQIKKQIDDAVNEKATELIAQFNGDQERKNELGNGVRWALESILARVERGMTVELRFIPPPQPSAQAAEPEKAAAEKTAATFNDLKQLAQELIFPAGQQNPVLDLPAPEPPPARG